MLYVTHVYDINNDHITRSHDIFYQENLYSFPPEDSIEISSGTRKEFLFQFTLPKNALESYSEDKISRHQCTCHYHDQI